MCRLKIFLIRTGLYEKGIIPCIFSLLLVSRTCCLFKRQPKSKNYGLYSNNVSKQRIIIRRRYTLKFLGTILHN